MAIQDLNQATTTNLANTVPDFIVDAIALENASSNQSETFWYFSEATRNFGYLFGIPEVWSAASALATYTTGQGWTTSNSLLKQELMHVVGYGKDSFSKIIWNHLITKWVVGDSFCEVKKKGNVIVNMMPISPERVRLVFEKNGQLKRYDVWNGGEWKTIKIADMLHSQNKRIGDSMHGTSMLDPLRFAIDFKNEMLEDERIIKHRDKAIGIVEYQTSNTTKISAANTAIEKAIKNGEMVGLPVDTAKLLPFPSKSSEDRLVMIQYLEGFIYQNFGVQRGMITSDGSSEVGGKMASVNFTPIHGKERREIEEDLLIQQQIDVKFGEPDSLGGLVAETDAKNTGQTNIQSNDVEASLTRE